VSTTGDVPALRVIAGAAIDAMGIVGALRAAWRSLSRLKVDMKAPPGELHLVELQVAPERRNEGLGGRLLDEVERIARQEEKPHVSLTTAIDNPARRLYERRGYDVVDERRNARYLARTGSPGRVLMVKHLDGT
jgi:ribosomal protein S18 acetylase RimI-like enzyme